MAEVQIEKRYGPTKKRIHEGIIAFNSAVTGYQRTKTFAVSVRDGDEIVGGAVGMVRREWLFIDELWLDERYRGKGFGSQVMDSAEDHGRALGAKAVYLDTFSFQARPFYEKRGYRVFGELENYPPGYTRYWLSKSL
jgi:GNAT superfamily N-acetyltransferase